MLGWELPPHNSGGLGIASYALAKTLTEKGVDVTFLLPEEMNYGRVPFKLLFAGKEKMTNIKNVAVNAYGRVELFFGANEKGSMFKKKYIADFVEQVFDYSKKAPFFAREEEIDIIHAHDWLAGVAGVKVKEKVKKPLVVHIHATEIDRAGSSPHPLIFSLEKEVMEKADKVVVVSNYTKEIITTYYGISPEKIEVVYNGFDFATYDLRQTTDDRQPIPLFKAKKIVLFVGRITMQKGPDYLLRAAKKVLQERDDVLFVFAGTGDMQRQILRQAIELGIADHVIFAGFLRGSELVRVYKNADLFVMPSVSEPFGLTALEALGAGVPTLISKQSGVSEVVRHTILVNFWDIDEMAAKMLSILAYEAIGKELSKNGAKEIKELTWEKPIHTLLGIYNGLLATA